MPAADSSGELTWAVERLIGHDLDGRYRIESLLGTGGMGAVLRARHLFMDQEVAIKVLRPTLARDPNAARRFVREARGTLKVDSEHAVKVQDFAIAADGMLYMVLELLDGRTVGAELQHDGVMAARRVIHVAHQVCEALAAAHRVGLVHRDLKPDNIMLVRRGGDPDFVKVLDFGLTKVMEHAGERALSMAALTQGDLVFGTPDYMAPEQAMGQTLDERTDLYALGATLFEMLTGRAPFVAASPMAVLANHVQTPPPTVRQVRPETDAPADLEAIIARCLAKAPEARPASAAALGGELAALAARLAGRPGHGVAHAQTVDLPVLGVAAAIASAPTVSATADDDLEPPRRRAPRVLIAGGLVVAAIGVALALGRGAPRGRPVVAAAPPDAALDASVTAPDRAAPDAAPVAIAVDAAVDRTAVARPAAADGGERAAGLARSLAAAETARRGGKRLKQIAHASAALELDPRSQRARYLLGDALIATGDQVNGCRYLRSASRIGAARDLARTAGCP